MLAWQTHSRKDGNRNRQRAASYRRHLVAGSGTNLTALHVKWQAHFPLTQFPPKRHDASSHFPSAASSSVIMPAAEPSSGEDTQTDVPKTHRQTDVPRTHRRRTALSNTSQLVLYFMYTPDSWGDTFWPLDLTFRPPPPLPPKHASRPRESTYRPKNIPANADNVPADSRTYPPTPQKRTRRPHKNLPAAPRERTRRLPPPKRTRRPRANVPADPPPKKNIPTDPTKTHPPPPPQKRTRRPRANVPPDPENSWHSAPCATAMSTLARHAWRCRWHTLSYVVPSSPHTGWRDGGHVSAHMQTPSVHRALNWHLTSAHRPARHT